MHELRWDSDCRIPKVERERGVGHPNAGFSIIDLMLAIAVILIVAAITIPTTMLEIHTATFRGVAAEFSSLLQTARIYAIRDNRFYSTYIIAASNGVPPEGYVDMLPKGAAGASGNGGASAAAGDPVAILSANAAQQAVAHAPNRADLQSRLLPANTPVAPTDATVTPITFGPRGLPCLVVQVTGGSVCNSLGGPAAYWAFFEDPLTSDWEAVTVTPAGRIQKWYYGGSVWAEM